MTTNLPGIGHNSSAVEETALIDVSTAEVVKRIVHVLAISLGHKKRSAVLEKKQSLRTLSLRQLCVYCLTNDNEDLAIVGVVELARIIGFDRGTVRDDRAAVERACEQDPETREFVDAAREMALAVPTLARGGEDYFLAMDIARSASRARQRRLMEMKRIRALSQEYASRAERALANIGRHDLAAYAHEVRAQAPLAPLGPATKDPYDPTKDPKPFWLRRTASVDSPGRQALRAQGSKSDRP